MTTSSHRRGPYAKTAARINGILDAAVELFATNGYRSATMKDIAEKAGISQPGLLHHFPGKADVLIALLRRREERALIRAAESDDLPAVDRILTIVRDLEDNRTLIALHCVLAAEATSPEHPAHEFFKLRYHRIQERATSSFQHLLEQGLLQPGTDPARLARTMVAVLDGLQLQWLLAPESVDITAELRAFLSSHIVNA
ncbi:TetR/AcrR family transcriptional regulator [Lentzea sp. NPDC051208]|uniref:TetR/AcrR family transcriptional regulator n=1 Tax=Lentzea sp. NPDC051208 TaxID=3154642 RepID=UPI00342DF4B6